MKKVLVTILAAAMLLTLLPATALAATTTAGTAAELATAITSAAGGDTIQLTANITGIQQMTIDKAITIDMNGFNISGNPTTGTAFRVEGGDLTLDNTSATQSKLLVGTGETDEYNYEGIRIANSGKAIVKANVSIETGLPVFIYGNGTPGSAQLDVYGRLEVTDDLPDGDAYATISGNGSAGKGGTIINIYSGAEVINTYSMPMYIPQAGVVNVYGGTITGKDAAIGIKSGTLNISGGTLRATGPATIPTTGYSNGINSSGCAIQIESNDAYSGNIVVNITGGTIISANGYALYEYLDSGNADTEVDSISISGGSFHSAVTVDSDILTSLQLAAAEPSRLNITGGIFSKGGSTEVKAGVDPTYTIVIPASVDFGTLVKDTGIASIPFSVTASGLLLEAGAKVNVTVDGDFTMSDGGAELPYALFKVVAGGTALTSGGQFASFSVDGVQNGRADVNTATIASAGEFEDTMTFTITYAD
jgi:hypothetical protein